MLQPPAAVAQPIVVTDSPTRAIVRAIFIKTFNVVKSVLVKNNVLHIIINNAETMAASTGMTAAEIKKILHNSAIQTDDADHQHNVSHKTRETSAVKILIVLIYGIIP